MKDRNYLSVQQHIFISFPFLFKEKKWLAAPMIDVIFVGHFPHFLNHGREIE